MKKEISLRLSLQERIKYCVNRSAVTLAAALSACVDEEVSPTQALRILHVVVAFTFLVFSYGNVLFSVLFLAWFALTLLDCRRAGLSSRM